MAMLISLMSFAQDAPVYELYSVSGTNNSYAGNCDVTVNGIKWNLTGNSTMDPWRIGGKSITNQDRALYSKTPLAYNIDKIEVTHGTASGITVNSFKLIISDEADGAGETIDVAFKASATTTIDLPEGDYTNKYFKFLYNVTNSTSNNKYVQFTGAKFYAALAEDAVKAPVITGAEDFISETEVTIEAEDDVTVYYTLDGTEPTTASTVYAAPFTVKETTTVKAIAYRGETASFVTSATFTQATRVTAAEAAELAMKVASNNALTSVTYVINAYVTSVIDQTLSSGQQRFWVADTKDGGEVLQSYYCNVPQVLKVGDYIQMFGKLTKYNTAPQMKNGDVTLLPAPVVNHVITVSANPAEAGVVTGGGEFEETDEITVKAVANEGYEFVNWTENEVEVSTAAEYSFEVLADRDLVANFELIPCTQATAINWDEAINAEANTDKWYAVNLASAIAAGKDIELTIANPGTEAVEITAEAYANCPATEKIAGATSTIAAGATKTTTIKFDEFLADQVEVVYFHVVSSGDLTVGAEAIEPEPEYELMELTMTNLSVDTYGEATGLWASDPDNGIEVMLFLDAEGNLMAESSIMVSWMDYPVTGTVTKAYNEELATDVYTAELYTTVDETNYKLIITMYYVPAEAIPVVVENAVIDDQTETSGFMYMTGEWTDAEGVVYPVSVEVPGFDATVAEAVYKNVTVTVGGWGEEDPWLGFVQGDATVTVAENVVTLTGVMSSWDGLTLEVTISGTLPEPVEPVEMVGVVKRAVQNGDEVIVLTHEADGTAHIYQVVDGVAVAEISQEGVVAVDTENAGDLLAISDIALTEDGKLLAINKIVCQAGDGQVDEGYKRGETRVYIWNDLAGAPSVWFTSKMSSNWYRSVQGHTMAYKGTSTNGTLVTTGITATGNKFRYSVYNVIDGVYTDPAVNDSEYYHYTKGSAQTTDNIGASYEINFSLLAENTWVLDGELVDPFEITDPLTYNTEVTVGVTLNEDLGKKYNGASYVTVGENVWMVAPFATPAGDLVAVEILDITNGLGAAQYVNMLYLEESVAATAAATAVQVTKEALVVTLVADATIYTMELPLSDEPDYQMYEDAITNLVIDYDNMLLIGGPSDAFQVEVVLGLGDYDRNTDNFALLPESSISVLGSEATFIDGIASVDGIAQTALAVVHCMWNGMALEFHLTMSAATIEPTVVVVENAVIEIEKVLLWGDMYDYALKMTGVWTNEGVDYPVLVEVPVYYPEATEPSIIFSTVTVGGQGDDDPWLGFGEGDLTITTEGDKITATGIVENPMAGIAIDITISGTITPTGIEDATVVVKPIKMIKNNQLIIEKDGVQYNVQGAILK